VSSPALSSLTNNKQTIAVVPMRKVTSSTALNMLYPLEVLGLEAAMHISLKTAHLCSTMYHNEDFPQALLEGNKNTVDKDLAYCLASGDDTDTVNLSSSNNSKLEDERYTELFLRIRKSMRDRNRRRLSVELQ
jgi:hypothetical protein